MWPWEHVAVGYVAVSLLARRRGWDVGAASAIAVVLGAGFPDLIDKPLAWAFDVLPSGTSVAHSVFVAVPLSLGVWVLARRLDAESPGSAFAVSYLLHLPADALYGPLTGDDLSVQGFLWPLVVTREETERGFSGAILHYARQYADYLSEPAALGYLVFELLLLGSAAWLWLDDGAPPLGRVRNLLGRGGRALRQARER